MLNTNAVKYLFLIKNQILRKSKSTLVTKLQFT